MIVKKDAAYRAAAREGLFRELLFFGFNEGFAVVSESPQRGTSEDGAKDATGFAAESPTRRDTPLLIILFEP